MSRSPSLVLLAALVIGLIGCEHATKHLAETELRGRPPTSLIAKVLDLQYTQNHDVGFSLLRKIPEKTRVPLIFAGGAAGLLLISLLWRRRRREGAAWLEQLAYATILAGALGNLTDRLLRGYVVDFVYLHYWPVFNLADAYLVVGVALVFLSSRDRQVKPSDALRAA